MKKWLLVLLVLVSTNYNVKEGDTLQNIAQQFCPSNAPWEQVAEFAAGIREINWDIMGKGEVKPGMVLTINHFE